MKKSSKPIARLRKGTVHKPTGKTRRIEAVDEKGGSGPVGQRGPVIGRGDFKGSKDIDQAIDSLKRGVRSKGYKIRFPDGSVEDPEEEED
jgi:hypothetical protein